jgi:hypothetical protein
MRLPEIKKPLELLGEFNKASMPMLTAEPGNIANSMTVEVSTEFWVWMNTTLHGTISVLDYIRINSLLGAVGKFRVNWVIGD